MNSISFKMGTNRVKNLYNSELRGCTIALIKKLVGQKLSKDYRIHVKTANQNKISREFSVLFLQLKFFFFFYLVGW